MHRLLLVEDGEDCRVIVNAALAKSNVVIEPAETLEKAMTLLREQKVPFDLIILDVCLPDGDGFSVLDFVRSQKSYEDVPVFLWSGREELASKVTAFSLGADDYISKSVNPIELRARVEMRLRRSAARALYNDFIRRGQLVLEVPMMKAVLEMGADRKELDLTTKEFKILCFLARNEGQVYSRNEIVRSVWGEAVNVLDRTVDSHVCSLRKKLRSVSNYVQCIPGAGYRFASFIEAAQPRESVL